MSAHFAVVPAPPGFSVVSPVANDPGETTLDFTPIVAQVVSYHLNEDGELIATYSRPVTFEGNVGLNFEYAIRYPDGRTLFPDAWMFSAGDDAAVIAEFNRRAKVARRRS